MSASPRLFFTLRLNKDNQERDRVVHDILEAYRAKHHLRTQFDALYELVGEGAAQRGGGVAGAAGQTAWLGGSGRVIQKNQEQSGTIIGTDQNGNPLRYYSDTKTS